MRTKRTAERKLQVNVETLATLETASLAGVLGGLISSNPIDDIVGRQISTPCHAVPKL